MAYVSWIVTVLEEKAVHRRDHLTISTCRAWLRRHPYPPHYARTARFRFKSTSSGLCSLPSRAIFHKYPLCLGLSSKKPVTHAHSSTRTYSVLHQSSTVAASTFKVGASDVT